MASLDSLPADQRAVLQLVLQRGRSYDQIAKLLSIDRGAVRERALNAFDALGPQTAVPAQRRGEIADYLLGQLEPADADQARDRIADSPSARAWARVVASELSSLSGKPLPEIPSSPSSTPTAAGARDTPVTPGDTAEGQTSPSTPPVPAATEDVTAAPQSGGESEPESRSSRRRGRWERKPTQPTADGPLVPAAPGARRSSRLGGAVLIALTVLIVAAIAIILVSSGSSNSPTSAASTSSSPPVAAIPSTPGSGTTSGSGTTGAKVIAQINLTPSAPGSKAAGIAEILKEGANDGIAIVAQNVAPNTAKPPNAYAVWLYNSASDSHILGFVNPSVGSNGRLSTAGGLPANASHFKQLIVTLETKASPKTPGTIILHGALTGL